jgi:hypothetical protein
MKIKKTISLRIHRPYYSQEVEAEVKAEKDRREAQGETKSLDSLFFTQLKEKHPEIITISEFYFLLFEIQKKATTLYNRAISDLYQRLIADGEKV